MVYIAINVAGCIFVGNTERFMTMSQATLLFHYCLPIAFLEIIFFTMEILFTYVYPKQCCMA